VTQYNTEKGEDGLFIDYISTFVKMKADASGYLGLVHRPENKERDVETVWQNEGIRLETEAIKCISTKRGMAKLCLNSMWGKLTKRNDRTMTRVITKPNELCGFLATSGVEVMNLAFASDNLAWISSKYGAEEDLTKLLHTNEVIGAYVNVGEESICIAFSTGSRRTRFIVTRNVLHTFNRGRTANDRNWEQIGVHYLRVAPLRNHFEICECWAKELRLHGADRGGLRKTVCNVRGIILIYIASKMVNF